MANARIGLPSNLVTGANSDLLLVQVSDAYPSGAVTFAFNQESRSITGIQKAAQLFLKVLFTTAGTDLLNPTLGTGFSDLVINSNVLASPREFLSNAQTEITKAVSQCIGLNGGLNSVDTASQLQNVQILGINTSNDSIQMYLRLVTVAGDFASVAIPFPQLNLNV